MIYAKMRGFKEPNEALKQIEQVKHYSPRTVRVPSARRSEESACRLQYPSIEVQVHWEEPADSG